ncbi:S-adenosyl-L-methionine-dependent methyltransferase [Xylariales sp. PMI_506]|nr:S-adenosyl-L-methionine-dependent methyltransferase [Xylariales sp. PMI_506]
MPALTKAQQKQVQAAADSFDRTYSAQYTEERWNNSLRPALTAPTRYAMLINRYQTSGISCVIRENDAMDLQFIDFPDFGPCNKGESIDKSGRARLISYQRSTTSETSQSHFTEAPFPAPQAVSGSYHANHLMTHWNLDAASLLAVAVLGPQPGDKVLDICAAPGGKSMAIAQLLRPANFDDADPSLMGGCLHSNEIDTARNRRLLGNLQAYLPSPLFKNGEVIVLRLDGSQQNTPEMLPLGIGGYDKVLVDAPCSSERHVLHAHTKAKQGRRVADEMAS